MAAQVDSAALSARVASSMPQLKAELARLVAIPSISSLGFPEHTRPALLEAYERSWSSSATPAWRRSTRSSCRIPLRS